LQDYLYVRGFVTFAGGVLASAPDKHIEVLLGGIGALTDEINWFRTKAQERGIELHNTGVEGGGVTHKEVLLGGNW
jgi:thiaminase/transcriptional activator TenA